MDLRAYVSLVDVMEKWMEDGERLDEFDVYIIEDLGEKMADAARIIFDTAIKSSERQKDLTEKDKDS
jgi:hypothetical protein